MSSVSKEIIKDGFYSVYKLTEKVHVEPWVRDSLMFVLYIGQRWESRILDLVFYLFFDSLYLFTFWSRPDRSFVLVVDPVNTYNSRVRDDLWVFGLKDLRPQDLRCGLVGRVLGECVVVTLGLNHGDSSYLDVWVLPVSGMSPL